MFNKLFLFIFLFYTSIYATENINVKALINLNFHKDKKSSIISKQKDKNINLANKYTEFELLVNKAREIYKNDKNKLKIINIIKKQYETLYKTLNLLNKKEINIKKLKKIKIHPILLIPEYKLQDNFYNLLVINTFINNFNDIKETIKEQIYTLTKNNNGILSKIQKEYYEILLLYKLKELEFYKKNLKKYKNFLLTQIKNKKTWNLKIINKNIINIENILKKKEKELELLKLNYEKWRLLDNKINMANMQKYIEINLSIQKKYYILLLKDYLYKFSYYYKNNNFQKTKNILKRIINNIKYIQYKSNVYDYFIDEKSAMEILNYYMKLKFKNFYEVKNNENKIKQSVYTIINYPIFKIGNKSVSLIHLIFFISIIIVSLILGKNWKKFVYKLRDKENISYSTATLVANIGYYAILLLFFLLGLNSIGIDLSSLTVIAGALSIGIGFGLQNIVSNFVSGIILMFEKSIKVGDYIQIDNEIKGEVIDILMRSTIVRTNDNIILIIPNQKFVENNVINWTMNDEIIRMRIPFSVAYGTDIEKMKNILLNELEKSKLPYIRSINKQYKPKIVFIEMADNSLNFYLYVYVKGKFTKTPNQTKSMFLEFIYNTLNKNGFVIPFPQQDLHIIDSVPIEIKLKK